MPRSRKNGGRSSASPSPTPSNDQRATWMNWQWQSVSDISMSGGESDLPFEYSESEDDAPKLATGHSFQHSREMSKSSRIVKFHSSSRSFDEEQDENHAQPSHQRKSRKHTKQQQESATSRHRRVWNAVSNLASNVTRSPQPKRSPSRTKQYPHHSSLSSSNATERAVYKHSNSETSPLLQNTSTTQQQSREDSEEKSSRVIFQTAQISSSERSYQQPLPPPPRRPLREERAIDICAAFLRDCEHGQRPSLPADLSSITDTLLTLRRLKYSVPWHILTYLACIALFLSSCLESKSSAQACGLNVFAIVIFTMDMWMGNELRKGQDVASEDPVLVLRQSRVEYWTMPMVFMLFAMTVEMLCNISAPPNTVLWTGILKPISLFYLSNKAKNALEALNRIFRIVLRVLVMELFLILSFATVACQLYGGYDSFHDLSTAFLSLFQLSTTVVNPSLWMPMYAEHRTAAFFFVLFVVTSVFYLHSLVLSVVFQTYVQASADIHDRSMTDREDAMRLAFLALESIPSDDPEDDNKDQVVKIVHVRKTLQQLRPHYNAPKINALLEIVDPSNQKKIDYPSFRTKIRQALNASIRSTRTASTFSVIVEVVASIVAVLNCIYVVMFSSIFDPMWFETITFPAGCVITILGAFELLARLGHVKLFQFTPITRLNATFDGLAAVAAIISFQGIFNYLTGRPHGLELLLIGRSIDMIRVMRFFPIFRDVVRRSGDVFPALAGPLALVWTSVHLFTYLGMALWSGAITIGDYNEDGIEPLYDYNNFNTYTEGLVTMFQVLVVNDWHAIAMVFLYATRCSSAYIVYPFFVGANLMCVSIMLNCLTAFFVGAFVTKLNDDVDANTGEVMTTSASCDFAAHSGRAVQRMTSQLNLKDVNESVAEDEGAASEEENVEEEMYEFDVYEREGYDKIMRTVAYGNDDDDEFARQICDVLEVFESLCPGRERVGYMVCCQKTLNRYGNRRFQSYARHYVHENALHMVVSDMHAELLLFSSRDRVLLREFRHLQDANKKLEVTASLIRLQPAMSLFVSRIVKTK